MPEKEPGGLQFPRILRKGAEQGLGAEQGPGAGQGPGAVHGAAGGEGFPTCTDMKPGLAWWVKKC